MALDLNSIGSLLSGGGVSAISKRTKVAKDDVAKVLSQGLPVLVAGMRRNADSKEGEAALTRALADHKDADTSNPAAFVKSADLSDGKKILTHVLGEDQSGVVDSISKSTGVTKAKTTSILALAAPLLLSLLGSSNSSNSSSGGLLGTLGGLLGLGSSGSQSGFLGGLLGGGGQFRLGVKDPLLLAGHGDFFLVHPLQRFVAQAL